VSSVQAAAGRALDWLEKDAVPLWGTKGVDVGGRFHERLNFDASPDRVSARRMRVQARQLYVFSEASVRGWWALAGEVAEAGFEALIRDFWARDGQPGFIHTMSPQGEPLDLKRDAYDHAFGLFALAWHYKATGEARALKLAREILDFLESRLADPAHGGFVESLPLALPRRADPHMHLLEACLEWSEATGEPRFLDIAARMVGLFKTRFFDPATGTIGEYFDEALAPASGAAGQATMPGHHAEWCWLLEWARVRGAGEARAEADRLYDFAVRHGLDRQRLAVDECDRQGRQVRRSRRAWPQTELIKAHICRSRQGLAGADAAAADAAQAFMDIYLATEVPGLWMDQFDAAGRGMTDAAPASTLYHVVVAFRELVLFAGP
jgi:mannose-6-phosphate isomerase